MNPLDLLSWILLVLGTVTGIIGAMGLYRFPDFYSRIHAAGVTDTLCAGLILLGLMLQAGMTLITVKLILILAMLWLTSPVASHALVQAAIHSRLPAWRKKQGEEP